MTTGIDALGYLGGIILSICTAPQIYHIWKRKSADDLSLFYLAAYTTGIILTATYLSIIEAWPAAIPCLIEVGMSLFLIFSKVYISHFYSEVYLKKKERSRSIYSHDTLAANESVVEIDDK